MNATAGASAAPDRTQPLGAIEFGGTKTLVAIGRDPLHPLASERIDTRDPETTLAAIEAFFARAAREHGTPAAVGVGAFGPIELRDGPAWGRIGRTPKPGWQAFGLGERLRRALGCAIELDTDVNAAALAEARWGAGRGLDTIAYLTVGTGIGGGLIVHGRPLRGALHPEIGHVPVRRHPDDTYAGCCAFHPDCAESLASGPAVLQRFGVPLDRLAADHSFRAILADYLGQVCATLVLVASPERIVIGGGVVVASDLHAAIESATRRHLGGYVTPGARDGSFVVPPALGDRAGLAGAFALAENRLALAPARVLPHVSHAAARAPVRRLEARRVEKVWGRRELPAQFGVIPPAARATGEIWFEDPSRRATALLVKYLFTSEPLSVQVHPDDDEARRAGHAHGKEEAWVVVDAEPHGRLGVGLRESRDRDALRAAAHDGSIADLLAWHRAERGAVFHVPPGTLHAIGSGLTLVEVQQNVDVTYRLYDYGRDRELQVEQALNAMRHVPCGSRAAVSRALAPGREYLVAGRAFVLERWSGTLTGTIDAAPDAPAWLVPLSGSGCAGELVLLPGAAYVAEGAADLRLDAGASMLVAYAGGAVRESMLVQSAARPS